MELIERNKEIDGRFVINDTEALALLHLFDRVDEAIDSQIQALTSMNEDSDQYALEALRLDLTRAKMEVLSELRRQIWMFDFERDSDEIEE